MVKDALRVIATSGLHDDERKQELARLGVPDVLAKPFDPRDILDAIHRELRGAR